MDYNDASAYAALGIFAVFGFIFVVAAYVISSLFLMKIFDKAGVQGRWRAWVPVYNSMVFLKLGDLSPWLILYAVGASIVLSWLPVIGQLIGLAAFALMVLAAYRVGLKLGKGSGWAVLYGAGIITGGITSLVWLGINAFDQSRWNPQIPPAPWAGNAFFGDRTVWDGVPVQPVAATPGFAAPGYGAAPQGYAPPQVPPTAPGYAPPPAPGYQAPGAPAAPGYTQPAPGYQPPAAPVTPPAAPPAAPAAPPATPPAPPTTPPTTAPPAAPPTEPPA